MEDKIHMPIIVKTKGLIKRIAWDEKKRRKEGPLPLTNILITEKASKTLIEYFDVHSEAAARKRSVEKGVLNNFEKLTEQHLWQSLFSIN